MKLFFSKDDSSTVNCYLDSWPHVNIICDILRGQTRASILPSICLRIVKQWEKSSCRVFNLPLNYLHEKFHLTLSLTSTFIPSPDPFDQWTSSNSSLNRHEFPSIHFHSPSFHLTGMSGDQFWSLRWFSPPIFGREKREKWKWNFLLFERVKEEKEWGKRQEPLPVHLWPLSSCETGKLIGRKLDNWLREEEGEKEGVRRRQ